MVNFGLALLIGFVQLLLRNIYHGQAEEKEGNTSDGRCDRGSWKSEQIGNYILNILKLEVPKMRIVKFANSIDPDEGRFLEMSIALVQWQIYIKSV